VKPWGAAFLAILAIGLTDRVVLADDSRLDAATQKVAAAQRSASERERKRLLEDALATFENEHNKRATWRAAAGAVAAASAWYWLATDSADYSEDYVAWQASAVLMFDEHPTVTLEFAEEPEVVVIDGSTLPGKIGRPLTFAIGPHSIQATSVLGNTGSLELELDGKVRELRAKVPFSRVLQAGEPDPRDPVVGKRSPPMPSNDWGNPWMIVTVVGTVTLAAGIAVGGGYLLLGGDNPKSFDTGGGVALIVTELLLIGAGTTLALLIE
jgi:hypothetical protein